ncbi:glycosyltransferase family 2 protein [Yoonia sp. BS5-3]|uniref:Glycosyltransferase family 2 protein n=1 Tax=Yoonia phaeophyticola TaxID=3137369 RepID=A0ABZ2V016_9RHOB
MPVFSIVMPCFNAAETILQTLESIRAQTCQEWELICVDDGSTDLTRDLIADAAKHDRRIRLAYNPGKGPSAARNFGATHLASGTYIAFCDADDLWTTDKLAETQSIFSTLEVDATFGKIGFFQDDPNLAQVFSTVPTIPLSIQMLLGENPVCTMSNITIRRRSWAAFGGFDPAVVHNEDLEWLIRIVGQGGIIQGNQNLQVWYRSSPNGLSADLPAMQSGRAHAIRTAQGFGVAVSNAAEAIHKRYLVRRALRLGHDRTWAAKIACAGFLQSPKGFMSPPRRGVLTLAAALLNLGLPRYISRAFFSH